jgi:hypothetical protein
LKECIVDDVTFAIFSSDDPVAFLDVAKAGIRSNCARVFTLFSVNKKWSAGTKSAHWKDASAGSSPHFQYTANDIKGGCASRKWFVKSAVLRPERSGEDLTKIAVE